MIQVTKTYIPPIEEYISYLESIWESTQITNNGQLCRKLADDISNFLGISNLELVANGTLALQLAIKAFSIQDEIITTPYSYVATTTAILWENCKPVFVDIEPETFCLDADLIETAITEKTSAILATHVYGYPCNVIKIQEIADKYNLKVLYDAAHAFAVRFHGKSILQYGDCSILSFHATKLFHTAEGGAVICKDAEVSRRISLMKKFGHIGEDDYLDIGINAKMSELHAAMGLCVLPKIDELIAYRRKLSELYDQYLASSQLIRPILDSEVEYNYSYYPVIFSSHMEMLKVRKALTEKGINPRRYFFPSLNTLPYLDPVLKKTCPKSETFANRVLCLPLYVGLEHIEVETICNIILRNLG